MLHSDVVDQFLDDDGFADTGAAKQPDLSAAQIRFEQVDDFDAGLEHLKLRRLLVKQRSLTMNRSPLLGFNGAHVVNRLSEDVEHAAESLLADRDS